MKLIDWIIIVLMFSSIIFLIWNYFNHRSLTCESNPFIYGASQLTEKYGYEFQGYGWFVTPLDIASPKITFNSTNLVVTNPV